MWAWRGVGAEAGSRQGDTQGGGDDKEAASHVGRSQGCWNVMRHVVRSGKEKVLLCVFSSGRTDAGIL